MAEELANDEVRVQVGKDVQLSEETTQALENLAEALAAEADDEVAGFSFQTYETDALFMMMGGGGGGPMIMVSEIGVKGNCAVDIVIKF